MFKYVSDFSIIIQSIIINFLKDKNVAIDATLGNGHDTDFLSKHFSRIYSFEIQKEACERYIAKNISNVKVINDSHHKFKEYIKTEEINCIIYNLGFLPGGDKTITTTEDTTIESILIGLELLSENGYMFISSYRGHDAGYIEYLKLKQILENLNKKQFGVVFHEVINRSNKSPVLFVIEKISIDKKNKRC